MADPYGADDTGVIGASSDRGSTTGFPGTPRWVKVFGIVVLVLVLLVVVVMVASGGQHGPGRHLPSGAPGDPGGHPRLAAQEAQRA